jgi:hypothetical protein
MPTVVKGVSCLIGSQLKAVTFPTVPQISLRDMTGKYELINWSALRNAGNCVILMSGFFSVASC